MTFTYWCGSCRHWWARLTTAWLPDCLRCSRGGVDLGHSSWMLTAIRKEEEIEGEEEQLIGSTQPPAYQAKKEGRKEGGKKLGAFSKFPTYYSRLRHCIEVPQYLLQSASSISAWAFIHYLISYNVASVLLRTDPYMSHNFNTGCVRTYGSVIYPSLVCQGTMWWEFKFKGGLGVWSCDWAARAWLICCCGGGGRRRCCCCKVFGSWESELVLGS